MESTTRTAIWTAVITGVFTVVAGLVTYWLTTRSPELSYTITASPTLSAGAGSKRIAVVEARNTGKREIGDVLVQVAFPNGSIDEFAFEASPGILVTTSRTPRSVDVRADLLNPEDFLKVSVLSTSASGGATPRVTVRAPGVRGKSVTVEGASKKDSWIGLLPILVATLATMLASLTISKQFSAHGRLAALISSRVPSSLDQRELCSFVLGECGLVDEAERIRFSASEMTYRGFSDYLLHRAASATTDGKNRILVALKTIALHKHIASASIETLRDAIERVSGVPFTSEQLTAHRAGSLVEGADPLAWRRLVREFITNQLGQH